MRAHVPGLASPHPLGERLPAMYMDDSFVQRMTGALDEVLAPVFSCLDNVDAYVDPTLAPEDFLQWLGSWVGLTLDESWPPERRRALLSEAVDLYRVRGTPRGLEAQLRLLTGAEVEIDETGGTVASTTPNPPPPGSPNFALVVRLRLPAGHDLDPARLDALVAAAKPAHVVHRLEVEVVQGGPEPPAPAPLPPPPMPVVPVAPPEPPPVVPVEDETPAGWPAEDPPPQAAAGEPWPGDQAPPEEGWPPAGGEE